MKEDCLLKEATAQADSQLEPSPEKPKNSEGIEGFNTLQVGSGSRQLAGTEINATLVVLKEKAGTVDSARTCFKGVMDGLFNSLSNGKNGLSINAVSDPLCVGEPVQVADLKVGSLEEREEGTDIEAVRVLEGVKGVLSFALGEKSLVQNGLLESEALIGEFDLFGKKEESSGEGLNEEKRTGDVQLDEEKLALVNNDQMETENGTGDVQLKEDKVVLVNSTCQNEQMEIENLTGEVQLKQENVVLVNSTGENEQMDTGNENGDVQLKQENVVLVNSTGENEQMDTGNENGDVQFKEKVVLVDSTGENEQVETENLTGEVQLKEENVVLVNTCGEKDLMDTNNETEHVQFKEANVFLVKSSEETGQMDIDNETGDVQLEEKNNPVLVNSSDEANYMDTENETGEVQLKEEKTVLVISSNGTTQIDTGIETGELQLKEEPIVAKSTEQTNETETQNPTGELQFKEELIVAKSTEQTNETETENPTGELQFKEVKPVLVKSSEQEYLTETGYKTGDVQCSNENPVLALENPKRNPKSDPLLVFTRRNPKRSTSSPQTDLNIDRLTRISNRGRKSKKEKEIEASDPKLLNSIVKSPNLATKKRNVFNRRDKPSIWGQMDNVEQVLEQSREFYNLKDLRDQNEKKQRALERERKEKEKLGKQIAPNLKGQVNLERDLDSSLTHEVSNHEATQKVTQRGDPLDPGSSPDSVVYNPANGVAGQNGSAVQIKEEQKGQNVLPNGASNPVAGKNGSGGKIKEEQKGNNVLPNGVASPVAGRNGSGGKNKEEKKGKGVLANGAASPVAGRNGSGVKKPKDLDGDKPWFYKNSPKGKKKEETDNNDDTGYNGVTIAFSPWMNAYGFNFPPPMPVLPLRSVPMVMTAKPLRSIPMALKPSDKPNPNPNPVPAPAFLAPTPPNRVRAAAYPVPAAAPASRVPDLPAYRVPAAYAVPAQVYLVPAQARSPVLGAESKVAPALANPVPAAAKPRLAWVCCDECGKWRCIPAELADLIDETNARWTCKENHDKRFGDCSIPQEKSNAEINAELELSDGSGDEGPSGHKSKLGEINMINSFAREMNPIYHSSGKKALHPTYYVPLKTNLFLNRNPRPQNIDEIMVCNCKVPKNGGRGCRSQCLNRLLSIECVKGMCPCGDLCSNQQFQRRDYAKLMWFRSGKKGFGLQSQEDVTAGRFLIEYVGEVLDMPTYEARQKEYAARGQKHFYFMTLNGGEVIDAFAKGNLGRFINHSCDPNCRTEKWIVNGEVCIGLFAIRDIKQGEELTFDYNYVRVFGAAAKKCFCGSKICRGYLGGDPSSTELVVQADSDEEEEILVRPVLPQPDPFPQPVIHSPKPVINSPKPVINFNYPKPVVDSPQNGGVNYARPVVSYQTERITSLQKYIVSENEANKGEVTGSEPNKKVLGPVKDTEGLTLTVECGEASRRLGNEIELEKSDKKNDLSRPFSSSSAGLPPYDFLNFERVDGSVQSENCSVSKEKERVDEAGLFVSRGSAQSKNCSVSRANERGEIGGDSSIPRDSAQSENCSVNRENEGMDRVSSPALRDTSQKERTDIIKSENCAVNREDVLIPVLDCSESREDVSVPNLPQTPVKEEGKEEREKVAARLTRSSSEKKNSKRLNGANIEKGDLKPELDKKALDEIKPKRARLVRNSEKICTEMKQVSEMKNREVKRDLVHEDKKITRNTDDDDFSEGVEERLNKLLDDDGGISRRKDATKGYLKLLIVTAAAGDTGTTQRLRDLSLILDALLKTKSRTVLTDIMTKNGLHMLHTILKQNRGNFNRIPIVRKLLKVLDFLAQKEILTLEQMNSGPPCPGAESFRDSIFKLTKHRNNLVHIVAREFFNKWMPKNMRERAAPSFNNPLKRKDRWADPPSQNPNFPPQNPNFPPQNPNFKNRYDPIPSPPKRFRSGPSQQDDAPPGFGPNSSEGKTVIIQPVQVPPGEGKTVINQPAPPVQMPAGGKQDRYRAGTSISYGIPAGTAQNLGTFVQSQLGLIWGIAPSIPFKLFPPLPQNPRVLEQNGLSEKTEKRREKESCVKREYKDERRRKRWEPYNTSNSDLNLKLESGSSRRRPRVSRWDKDEKFERKNKYDNYNNNDDKKEGNRASSWPKCPREERR